MLSPVTAWLPAVDAAVAAALIPLAAAILISGIDDLFLDALAAGAWVRRRLRHGAGTGGGAPAGEAPRNAREKRIAIFVPLWKEHRVIAGMAEHNIAAIRYKNYDFFIGAYPNDERTLDAVRDLESRFPRVHLAVCPHDGPTSKADCLNWIYQRMLLHEERGGQSFEIVVTHDAEDLIHPEALASLNYYCDHYDMVQVPVLPLPTPLRDVVHGVYCDEFAEWQTKDMPAREMLRSFVPSNGVGTGYTRAALESLATADHNLIFEPASLTEDYENGLRLHRLGCRQTFLPIRAVHGSLLATREYFPRNVRGAIRQRTRWIMGIALQTWERHGWSGNAGQVYWFWRDRKGLLANPASLLTNVLFVYGAATWLAAHVSGGEWGLERALPRRLLAATLALQAVRAGVRMACTARVYGWRFALGAPLRSVAGNYINSAATFQAVFRYARAKLRNEPLVWLKTEHAYPSRGALAEHKRKLGEILAGSGYVSEADVAWALATQPPELRLGEYLVALGKITEEELYEALSLQQSLPAERLAPRDVGAKVARALPRHVIRDWRVLPVRIASGSMYVASPEIPTDELARALYGFTRLALRFQLVTPANFDELTAALL